jgi:hypothetical protein
VRQARALATVHTLLTMPFGVQCEDYSQVGSFLLCFKAQDRKRTAPFSGHAPLTSYPGMGLTPSCLVGVRARMLTRADGQMRAFIH